MMEVNIASCVLPKDWEADVLLLPLCKDTDLNSLPQEIKSSILNLVNSLALTDFHGEEGEMFLIHRSILDNIKRVFLIGVGEKCTQHYLREAIGSASRFCRQLKLETLLIPLELCQTLGIRTHNFVEAVTSGALLGLYVFNEYKSDPKENSDPKSLTFVSTNNIWSVQSVVQNTTNCIQGIISARDLGNTPSNVLTPEKLSEYARDLARNHEDLECEVLDTTKLKELGCNGILAVGEGSKNPPCMVVLIYIPPTKDEYLNPIVFVGKGISFDSGGISLKSADDMHIMKNDMAGVAAILGALKAIVQQKIRYPVIAVLPCAENMPDGNSMKPGDIIRMLNGTTVEIMNTDAEGRLVLADALVYAHNICKPEVVVDIATLTGSCMTALGDEIAGLFTSDDDLAQLIVRIGSDVDELFWRLPLHENYIHKLDSDVADLKNTAGSIGGSICAALFLKQFMDKDIPYAHIDIASVDWQENDSSLCPTGSSGFGVRTLVELVRHYDNQLNINS